MPSSCLCVQFVLRYTIIAITPSSHPACPISAAIS
jgi:hypothetical protein